LAQFKGHADFIADAYMSADASTLVTASTDLTIKLWKRTGELLKSFDVSSFIKETYTSVDRVAFIRNRQFVVSTTTSGEILLLDMAKGTIRKLALGDPGVGVLVLNPTDNTARDLKRHILDHLDPGDREKLFTAGDPRQGVWAITFAANSQLMASTGTDGIVRLWGVEQIAVDQNKNPLHAGSLSCKKDRSSSLECQIPLGGPRGKINNGQARAPKKSHPEDGFSQVASR
jgi:WD40 repeat protein